MFQASGLTKCSQFKLTIDKLYSVTKALSFVGLVILLVGGSALWGYSRVLANVPSLLPADYEVRTAVEKLSLLWGHISRHPVTEAELETKELSLGDIASGLSASFAAGAFLNVGDEMPAGRNKVIHANGAVAQFEFTPEAETPFSGIFKTGAVGVLRLSTAAPNSEDFTPGMALKFMIDQKPSSNLVAMYSLNGQGADLNFFSNSFRTTIAAPQGIALKIGAAVFERALDLVRDEVGSAPKDALTIPLNDLASVDRWGHLVEKSELRVPSQLFFVPTKKAQDYFFDNSFGYVRDFRATLATFPRGAGLYWVYAYDHSKKVLIGRITITSEFIASKFGDKHLYFKHPLPRSRQN
jgi:hypothetical protein